MYLASCLITAPRFDLLSLFYWLFSFHTKCFSSLFSLTLHYHGCAFCVDIILRKQQYYYYATSPRLASITAVPSQYNYSYQSKRGRASCVRSRNAAWAFYLISPSPLLLFNIGLILQFISYCLSLLLLRRWLFQPAYFISREYIFCLLIDFARDRLLGAGLSLGVYIWTLIGVSLRMPPSPLHNWWPLFSAGVAMLAGRAGSLPLIEFQLHCV